MTEREPDESSQPRKRIAVACGRCRKRKIRCSGDPGNGGPCSNCKNAGHEPCLFLRVSSTETPFRDGPSDYGYNVEAARTYHARGAVSPHHSVAQYNADMSGSDIMNCRQSTYPYTSGRGYYSNVSGWGSSAYGEDSVDYGLNYSSYSPLSQDPVNMVPSYRYGSAGRTSVYVDPEASNYSYGNLVHRPAVSHDLPTLSLSGMAASLPTPNRLSTINRTLPSTSTYRTDDLPGQYPSSSKSSACHSSDVGYTGLNSTFDTYGSATLPSNVSARSAHPDAGTYQSTAGAAGAAGDGVDNTEHPSYRSAHESDSYIYSDRLDNRRDLRTSGSTGAGSVLSNGQIYIPETQSHASAHGYSISATNTAAAGATVQPGGIEGATTAVGAGGGCVTSQVQAAGHRRSAGNLRGA